MVIRFEPLQKRLLRADAARRRVFVHKVRRTYIAFQVGRIPLAKLCSDAGSALQDYAAETLDALLGAIGTREAELTSWALDVYHDGISQAGVAMRDAVADPAARHAVAQTLQERMLRAESRLYQTISAALPLEPRP
jgi:hypothetical protein